MANNAGRTSNRRGYEAARNTAVRNARSSVYVDGNTARRLQTVPQRKQQPSVRRKPEVSAAARRNRARAASMNVGFVLFLTAVSVAILICGVHFLQMKAEITTKIEAVAALESELSQLREDNNSYDSQISSTADLNAIKKKAMGELGMKYPTEDQIVTYETSRSSYVRQYQDVPNAK